MSSGASGRKTPVLRLFGSQESRKHSCAEWSKERWALLIKVSDGWPLSSPRCCCRVWQWDRGRWQHGQPPGPLLFCGLRQEKAEGQPAQGVRSDSPRLAVWTPIQCLPLRARKSVTVPTNTPLNTTGKGKECQLYSLGVWWVFFPKVALQHSCIASL